MKLLHFWLISIKHKVYIARIESIYKLCHTKKKNDERMTVNYLQNDWKKKTETIARSQQTHADYYYYYQPLWSNR